MLQANRADDSRYALMQSSSSGLIAQYEIFSKYFLKYYDLYYSIKHQKIKSKPVSRYKGAEVMQCTIQLSLIRQPFFDDKRPSAYVAKVPR